MGDAKWAKGWEDQPGQCGRGSWRGSKFPVGRERMRSRQEHDLGDGS